MAGEMSNYGADKTLNFWFRLDQTVTRPSAIYLALATATISDTTTGATVTEPTDGSYARQLLSNGSSTNVFGAPADVGGVETIKNSSTVSFDFATGGTAITYAAVVDSATTGAGNIITWFQLDASKTPSAGDKLEFVANAISIGIE